ncbi:MAG: type II toxin-antitoxin system RelE/ParE family toxin [Micromonosporaceae bacterium]|nr:type II toxin-antitoxin system RelE/ParE family toxin [Micromonosporaceae bacterium]
MTEPPDEPEPYRLRLAGSAAHCIEHKLPETVAAAVIEFITGSLSDNPHRVGKPLRDQLAGKHSARRGAFRVVYEIDDGRRVVTVLRIEHRADVYRPR